LKLKAPLGTEDILPAQAALWQRLEAIAREVFARWGYGEIRTPVLEFTSLFVRSIGEATDVVEKEMYVIGEGDDSLALRPEATASVVRAYLQANLHKVRAFQKFYYIGPMFRHERPQAGRRRQFHQMGIEAIGSLDPLLDAEVVTVACELFGAFGLSGFRLRLNSIGTPTSRRGYRELIRERLGRQAEALCPDCRRRLERNVFRILDCKRPACVEITRNLPAILDHLPEDEREHFRRVCSALRSAGVEFEEDPYLVRGFDYYTATVFEITHGALGAQDALCGGGRYDNLVADLGGPPLGAVGFAIGVERVLMALRESGQAEEGPRLDVFVATVGGDVRPAAFTHLVALRRAGLRAETDYEGRSLKAQMRSANKLGARFVLIVGEDEARQGVFRLRNMATAEEKVLPDIQAVIAEATTDRGSNRCA